MSDDESALSALRRLRAGIRAGITPRKRSEEKAVRRSGDSDPQLLGAAVSAFLEEHDLASRHRVARVLEDWTSLVGPEVAAHVVPESFDDGDLLLRADSTAWANQMRLLGATLQRRLGEELGADVVRSIRVLGPEAPSWRHGNRHIPGRGPRDTYG